MSLKKGRGECYLDATAEGAAAPQGGVAERVAQGAHNWRCNCSANLTQLWHEEFVATAASPRHRRSWSDAAVRSNERRRCAGTRAAAKRRSHMATSPCRQSRRSTRGPAGLPMCFTTALGMRAVAICNVVDVVLH